MLPIVSIKEQKTIDPQGKEARPSDKRKLRDCQWKEIRLCITRVPESIETYYGIAQGEPHIIGCMMLENAKHKGLKENTYIHAISDGAPWIADQYEEQFGANHRFHVDIYHLYEYLAKAVNSTELEKAQRKEWLEKQKQNLRASEIETVLEQLEKLKKNRDPKQPKKAATKPEEEKEEKEEIETAINYIRARTGQFEYKEALEKKLPIGSGEVESGHRHILQKRLKIPGAWWRLATAEAMGQLRAMRANNRWPEFWEKKCA